MSSFTTETTIHDIARRLDVSATTVWRAINNRPRVSHNTRKRVLAEVERVGFRPSLVARNLSRRRTQTLGVVVPTIRNAVHAALVRAVEQSAFDRQYSIVLCDTDFSLAREQQYLDLLIRRRVEGVLLVPYAKEMPSNENHLLQFIRAGMNVVCMQHPMIQADVSQVVPDNFAAGREMTRHLLRLGHRRIAFLHGGLTPWQVSINERLRGYYAAIEEAGLDPTPDWIVEAGSFDSIISDEGGEIHSERIELLLKIDRPTAIFAPVDILAIKVLSVVRRLGFRVPDDVAIVGFDDIQMSGYTDPPLTTVRHPTEEVGRRAAELLFKQLATIECGKSYQGDPVIELVPCDLVVRKSCGASIQSNE